MGIFRHYHKIGLRGQNAVNCISFIRQIFYGFARVYQVTGSFGLNLSSKRLGWHWYGALAQDYSVAALVPQCELDGLIDIYSHDAQSRLMNQALRKIHLSLSRSQTLVIFVNQIRTRSVVDISQRNEVTCGGNALKFYSAIRMRITRRNLLHTEEKITGIGISVQVMKNKLSRSMKTVDLDIEFGRGLRHEAEVLEMASKHGIVMREGDGYWINGDFFENQIKAEVYLQEKIEVADELVAALRSQLFEMVPEDE